MKADHARWELPMQSNSTWNGPKWDRWQETCVVGSRRFEGKADSRSRSANLLAMLLDAMLCICCDRLLAYGQIQQVLPPVASPYIAPAPLGLAPAPREVAPPAVVPVQPRVANKATTSAVDSALAPESKQD